jgi:light-regulated signal transduction histidine kinase (bacteriophytochrome)
VQQAIGELEIEIEKSNARIHVSNLPDVWVIPGLMQQLFYNLIKNAIKFRKNTVSPEVYIDSRKLAPSELDQVVARPIDIPFYKLTVTDNGIGFDQKYADDIFVVFKRLHSYHEFEGTGVGLSICKKIIEKHNGFIQAKSELSKGSTFSIGLPERPLMQTA